MRLISQAPPGKGKERKPAKTFSKAGPGGGGSREGHFSGVKKTRIDYEEPLNGQDHKAE